MSSAKYRLRTGFAHPLKGREPFSLPSKPFGRVSMEKSLLQLSEKQGFSLSAIVRTDGARVTFAQQVR
jgi:hypothetical protein